MAVRFAIILLTLLSVAGAPAADAAWTQHRGDSERSGSIDAIAHPLDVVGYGHLASQTASGDDAIIRLLDTAGVFVAGDRIVMVDNQLDCEMFTYGLSDVEERVSSQPDLVDLQGTRNTIADCATGSLVGVDPERGLGFVCGASADEQPLFHAVDVRTGATAWSIVASTDLNAPLHQVRNLPWICRGAAIDHARGVVYATFSEFNSADDHRIAAFAIDDGETLWARPIDLGELLPSSVGPEVQADLGARSLPFFAWSVTTFGNELLVLGRTTCLQCTDPSTMQSVAVTMDAATGTTITGRLGSAERDGERAASNRMAATGAARAGQAVAMIGDQVQLFHAGTEAQVQSWDMPIAGLEPDAMYPSMAWNSGGFLAATDVGLAAFKAGQEANLGTWTVPPGFHLVDMMTSEAGAVLAIGYPRHHAGNATAWRVDVAAGATLQGIPLPMEPVGAALPSGGGFHWSARILPVPDVGLMVVDMHGEFAMLDGSIAATGDSTPLRVSDAYPRPGAEVVLALPTFAAQIHTISWGDGAVETAPGDAGSASHRYADAGDRQIVVTTTLADGTTRTATAAVHVGGERPPGLNAIQRLFTPERQDMTWGIIGVLLVLIGALATIGRSRLRKNRLEDRLRRLERIRDAAGSDVAGAIEGIEAYRQGLRAELSRGKLDDIQYSVLESESHKVLAALKTRLVAPFEGRLSRRYRRLLLSALEDGILTEVEGDALLSGLRTERKLRADERERLAGFIETWAHRHLAARRRDGRR